MIASMLVMWVALPQDGQDAAYWWVKHEEAGGYNFVDGDEERFRETFQVSEGFLGGLRSSRFRYEEDDVVLTASARALHEADYGVSVRATRFGLGYLSAGFDQIPRFTDSSTLSYNWAPGRSDAGERLRLDSGRLRFEAGLRDPELPYITIGYERIRRTGTTNLFYGGHTVPNLTGVADPSITGSRLPADLLHAYVTPLFREIDTTQHRVHADVRHDFGDVDAGIRFEWDTKEGSENYDEPWFLATAAGDTGAVLDATSLWRYSPEHSRWTIHPSVGIDVIESVLRLDIEYGFIRATNRSELFLDSMTPAGGRYFGNHALVILDGTEADNTATTHRPRLRLNATPHDDWSLWFEGTYTSARSDNDSVRLEDGTEGAAGGGNSVLADEVWLFENDTDEETWREELGVRFTGIPDLSVTVTGELEHSAVLYDWNADFRDGPDAGVVPDDGDWLWRARGVTDRWGVSTRLAWDATDDVTFHPYYRLRNSDFDLSERVRAFENKPGDPEFSVADLAQFYPGRIQDTTTVAHAAGLRCTIDVTEALTLRPHYGFGWLEETNHDQRFERLGRRRTHEYGLGIDAAPDEFWTISCDVTRLQASTRTQARHHTNSFLRNPLTGTFNRGWRGGLIESFANNSTSLSGSVRYAPEDWSITCRGGATWMETWWMTQVSWIGTGFRHRIEEQVDFTVDYTYARYDESGNQGFNDFEAHMILLGFEFTNSSTEE